MGRTLLSIAIGGAAGSVLRYLAGTSLQKLFPSLFPVGTFAVNIVGCFLIGVIFALFEKYEGFNEEWRIFLAVGFCGGFTTFSAFAIENIRLLQGGQYAVFALYTFLSIALGFFAVWAGNKLI